MIEEKFFLQNGIALAKALLGKYLIRQYSGKAIITQIVETEAYMGVQDKGAHVYGDKRTERTKPLYLSGGHIYIYLIYGMYYCINISANAKDIPECVLIRALKPIDGLDEIAGNRYGSRYEELNRYQIKNLLNGPGKLCQGLLIDKTLNGKSILSDQIRISDFYRKDGREIRAESDLSIQEDKRVNIDYAEEAKDFLWRFYMEGSPYVSKR